MTGAPLHMIIIGIPICIILSISLHEASKMSGFMDWAGDSWHVMRSGLMSNCMLHMAEGIIDIEGIIIGIGMAGSSSMHTMHIFPTCMRRGIPASAIISII